MDFFWGVLAGMVISLIIATWKGGKGPYSQEVRVWIQEGPNHVIILRSLDPDRLAALAERMNNGRPFRFAALVGPKKLLSRSEWVRLRKELIDRDLMEQARNRTLSPTPLGREFFKAYTTTRAHMHKREIKHY